VSGILFDIGPQPPDVDVDQAAITEVAVAPDAVEEGLAGEQPPRVLSEFAQQLELGLRVFPRGGRCSVHVTGEPCGGDSRERAEHLHPEAGRGPGG